VSVLDHEDEAVCQRPELERMRVPGRGDARRPLCASSSPAVDSLVEAALYDSADMRSLVGMSGQTEARRGDDRFKGDTSALITTPDHRRALLSHAARHGPTNPLRQVRPRCCCTQSVVPAGAG
jgi:hypothetical protein